MMNRSRSWPVIAGVLALLLGIQALISMNASAESLFNEETYRPIAGDHKAFRPGDLLTVQVVENSSATSNTDTSTRRNNGINLQAALSRNATVTANLGEGGDFSGGGRTQRATKLLAQITVSVREIMPGGDLRVAGEQLLLVNGEQQKVTLEGRVRPQDIADNNVVLSTRLADAKIDYIGEGDLAERQKRSWWRKSVDWLGF